MSLMILKARRVRGCLGFRISIAHCLGLFLSASISCFIGPCCDKKYIFNDNFTLFIHNLFIQFIEILHYLYKIYLQYLYKFSFIVYLRGSGNNFYWKLCTQSLLTLVTRWEDIHLLKKTSLYPSGQPLTWETSEEMPQFASCPETCLKKVVHIF